LVFKESRWEGGTGIKVVCRKSSGERRVRRNQTAKGRKVEMEKKEKRNRSLVEGKKITRNVSKMSLFKKGFKHKQLQQQRGGGGRPSGPSERGYKKTQLNSQTER